MTTRAEGVAATRDRILDAVLAVITEGRVHDASMEAIAKRAGVTRVTLYRTFGSKQALLEGFVLHTLAQARLDLVDAAHAEPDVRTAVRQVLLTNCRMFASLGGAMPFALELARSDRDMRAFIDATYHGRRHRAMETLAARILAEGASAPGWTKARIADGLLVLSSYEAFQTLAHHRGRSVDRAAADLYRLARAFLADDDPQDL
jgi:AcrR family transcriptional regulator